MSRTRSDRDAEGQIRRSLTDHPQPDRWYGARLNVRYRGHRAKSARAAVSNRQRNSSDRRHSLFLRRGSISRIRPAHIYTVEPALRTAMAKDFRGNDSDLQLTVETAALVSRSEKSTFNARGEETR